MADGLPGLFQQLLDLVDALPAPSPIKLTKVLLDQLRAAVPTRVNPDPAAMFTGVPIVLVESTKESTPYLEGWIKCPSCGTAAIDHNELACDKRLVFGPFGDFAVRRPPSFVPAMHRLLTDPGITNEALERIKLGILAMAASADVELAGEIARWEGDGGACR